MISVCDRYERQRPEFKPEDIQNPSDFLKRTVTWMIDDAVAPETSRLFLEFWILAKQYEFGTEIIERSYASAVEWLITALGGCFPYSPQDQREQAAYYMLTISEGSLAVFSRSYQRSVDQSDMVDFAVAGIMSILQTR